MLKQRSFADSISSHFHFQTPCHSAKTPRVQEKSNAEYSPEIFQAKSLAQNDIQEREAHHPLCIAAIIS
jgi:hypothetical protein